MTALQQSESYREQHQRKLLAIYSYVDDTVKVIKRLREKNVRIDGVFSPTRSKEMQEALGSGWSRVAFFTLLGGITGGVGLISLAVYAHLSFHLVTWGKPIIPPVPWVIVCFEGTILFSVLFSFVAWIFSGRLPEARLPVGYDEVFSGDKFGILVPYMDYQRQEIYQILADGRAEEIREILPSDRRKAVLEAEASHAAS